MKSKLLIIVLFSYIYSTFSIVAVDLETGEVGSAGGSCIGGSIIISDIHPGIGAIHTQSYWTSANQNNASELMDEGYSPYEIIEYLESNDVSNNPFIRQYGIVDMYNGINYGYLFEDECNDIPSTNWSGEIGSGELGECTDIPIARSAAFTGSNCSDWKGHIEGISYSIQGNILLNEGILLSMEENFINTIGPLDKKLMAALQGANIPGADVRCLDEGISTLSSFIRVAKPDDINENFYIDLNVDSVIPYYNQTGIWLEPIDSLQTMYDNWYDIVFEYDIGDSNQDFTINILDVVSIVNHVLGDEVSGLQYFLSDLNEDNNINIQDIIILVGMILGSHDN